MNIVSTEMTVADYCNGLDRGEIIVNRTYQRSDRVWPPMARSYLIETILLGFPIPKLSLHQVTDLKSRRTIKEVVDGQQRSRAIRDFFHSKLRLSRSLKTEEAAGLTYEELDGELQQAFLDYGLSFDLFVGATPDDVREVFRRINSFTVPLNPEEHRHAVYQGPFKWFIHHVARQYDEAFVSMGTFTEKQVVRMVDMKLLTEIAHAFFDGITTTSKGKLDSLYRSRDVEFPEERQLEGRISRALDQLLEWEEIHQTAMTKHYMMYSLMLAVMHAQDPVASLQKDYELDAPVSLDTEFVIPNLTTLADALGTSETPDQYADFVKASSEKTNVGSQRRKRFQWLARALTEPALL